MTLLGHAVRIAHYLYPNAYLSSASAALLAPTPDGRLFISGRRNQRTRLRPLDLLVAWHCEPLGRLTHDGFAVRYSSRAS